MSEGTRPFTSTTAPRQGGKPGRRHKLSAQALQILDRCWPTGPSTAPQPSRFYVWNSLRRTPGWPWRWPRSDPGRVGGSRGRVDNFGCALG